MFELNFIGYIVFEGKDHIFIISLFNVFHLSVRQINCFSIPFKEKRATKTMSYVTGKYQLDSQENFGEFLEHMGN